jgi:HAD superfamily hydrolase (TIGR01490 family)
VTDAAADRRVAAFDFDGTITRRDTLGPFLARVCGRARLYTELARRSPALGATLAGWRDRDLEKERLVGRLLAGRSQSALAEEGRQFAAWLERERPYRRESLDRLAWHRAEGHEIVIVSAGLDVYLDPLAPTLGIEHVLCTRLEADSNGTLTGRLHGANVRGAEKARRLQEWLGDGAVELWAYGDSAGDREFLALADHPTRVGGRGAVAVAKRLPQ